MTRFAIDERSYWLPHLTADAVASQIASLLDLMEECQQAGHGICYDQDLILQPIWDGSTFWELFERADLPLLDIDREKAAIQFSTLIFWDETREQQPTELDVSVAGGPDEASGTIAWAHAQADRGIEAAACITSGVTRPIGRQAVQIGGGPAKAVWFVDDSVRKTNYIRDLIAQHARNVEEFGSLAAEAFADLKFMEGCFGGIRDMSRAVQQIAPDLVRHLSVLSDEGAAIFAGPWQNAPAQFAAFGVNISDENGNTKQNAKARRERTLTVDGQELLFWWHTKIAPDRDRIHIHPDGVAAGRPILVGIFCRHLTN